VTSEARAASPSAVTRMCVGGLLECAQHDAAPPKVSKELSRRQEGQSRQVRAIRLAGAEPSARSLHPSFGPAPAPQQSDRGCGARALRLLSGNSCAPNPATRRQPDRPESDGSRGTDERTTRGGDTKKQSAPEQSRSGSEAAGHGSQPTSSRCVKALPGTSPRSPSTRHLECWRGLR
jgi:hypothetical protein